MRAQAVYWRVVFVRRCGHAPARALGVRILLTIALEWIRSRHQQFRETLEAEPEGAKSSGPRGELRHEKNLFVFIDCRPMRLRSPIRDEAQQWHGGHLSQQT